MIDLIANLIPFNILGYFELGCAGLIPGFILSVFFGLDGNETFFFLLYAITLTTIDILYRKIRGHLKSTNPLLSTKSGGHILFIPTWVFGWILFIGWVVVDKYNL